MKTREIGIFITNYGFFPTKDVQVFHPPPAPLPPHLSFDQVFMDDAECAEYNE